MLDKLLDDMFLSMIDISISTMLGIFISMLISAILFLCCGIIQSLSMSMCVWFWATVIVACFNLNPYHDKHIEQ